MVLMATHYILLSLAGSFAIFWSLLSMGIIKPRDNELASNKSKHLDIARNSIEETYRLLEAMPPHNREKIFEHLDNGEVGQAHKEAKSHHDVFHFFKNN